MAPTAHGSLNQPPRLLAIQTSLQKYFDVNKPVTLSVDSSYEGMGAVLLQDDQPVAYASKALTKTQKNYSQIERELLAIFYGCTKFNDYIYGQKSVKVLTDHKPLQAVFRLSLIHISEPTRRTPISYAVFCLKKKK